MQCGMCEAHLNDAIRSACHVKKVTSSHKKDTCMILTECDIPNDVLQKAISGTGYALLSVSREAYCKKGFFARLFYGSSTGKKG